MTENIDLVVTRTLRVLALGADSGLWAVWLDGYADVLALLERGDRSGAVARYRRIYRDYRAQVETVLFLDPDEGPG